jgi:hypothetical protein
MAKYEISIYPAIIIAMSYLMIFVITALLPVDILVYNDFRRSFCFSFQGYTSRMANKLSKLLTDNQYLTTK